MATPKKNIILLGGTGPSGLLTLKLALNRGHHVTVYARSPQKIPQDLASHSNIKIVKGSLEDTSIFFALLPGTDTIISLLGPTSPWHRGTELSTFYTALLKHLQTVPHPPQILALNTISITQPTDTHSLTATLLVWTVYLFANGAYTELHRIAAAFQNEGKGLPWTNFRVAWLADGLDDGEANVGMVGKGGWVMRMEKRELASWCVGEAERGVDGSQWMGKMPALFGNRWRKKDL
ncbi:NAD(P)-binding protein [Acephala macrosclerotiorum]|nr:NAD(P)-binding protein [Acephala macrosclerotiorum]